MTFTSVGDLLPNAAYKTLFTVRRGFSLSAVIAKAERLRLATAFMNLAGLSQLKLRKSECKTLQVLVGGTRLYDTDPKALRELLHLKERMRVDAFVCELKNSGSFHPKVLLVEGARASSAVLGSSNCTTGGYQNNVEANILLEEPGLVRELHSWFDALVNGECDGLIAKRLTPEFVDHYESDWRKAQAKRRQIVRLARKHKVKVIQDASHERRAWRDLVKEARRWRRSVRRDARSTALAVTRMRTLLDYPRFHRLNRQRWRQFFSIPDLGRLNPLYRDRVMRRPQRLRAALRALIDDASEVGGRLDEFLKLKGVGPNLATKILTIHDRKRCPTWNEPVEDTLRDFGVRFPRGLSFGRRYVDFQNEMQTLAKAAGYKDMLDVDVFLYQYWWAEE